MTGKALSGAARERQLLEARLKGFEKFAEWERSNPLRPEPEVALSGTGFLYDLLPASARKRPVDASGVQEMHRRLSVLQF